MVMNPARAAVCVLVLGLTAAAAPAQFTQYTRPGRFDESPLSTKKLLDEAIEDAKWSAGRLRLDPWLGVREITYDDNVGGRAEGVQSDLTATVGLGLRAYLPVGEDLILAGHLLPEYVWWRDLEDRRRVNGRAGVGLFGTVGRTALELSVSRIDDARFYSREFEDQVNTRDEIGALSLEAPIGRGFALFGAGRVRRLRFLDDDPGVRQVRALDRDETVARAGLRYAFRRGVSVGLGAEYSEATFEQVDSLRDNSGTAPLLEIAYSGRHLYFDADVAVRDLEFEDAPAPIDYDRPTGGAKLRWYFVEGLGAQLYTRRNLVYSFSERWAYYEDRVGGVALVASLGAWGRLRVFGELGTNEYQPVLPTFALREDEFDGYGAELILESRRVSLQIEFSKTEYDSNLSQFDRDVTIIRTGIVFGGRSLSPWV